MENKKMQQDWIKEYQPFWDEWVIEESLGNGGFGQVYKICKDSYGMKQYSALKVIHIEHEKQKEQVYKLIESTDNKKVSEYYDEVISSIVNEINLLYKLKGHGNVISYEDYKIIKLENFNWIILIRMELAEPLDKYLNNTSLNRGQIINFAFEMLNSLDVCHKNNIIHRDIKEQNIFISNHGKFKLGDFGVAKESIETNNFYTQVGTYAYSAPEVLKGTKYDNSVDIYSLGIILYKLLNNGRYPFVEGTSFTDVQKAIGKRLSGEKLFFPINANDDLGKIILKSCEYSPQNRYRNINEMKNDLAKVFDSFDEKYLSKIVYIGIYCDKNTIENTIFDTSTKLHIKSDVFTDKFKSKDDLTKDASALNTLITNEKDSKSHNSNKIHINKDKDSNIHNSKKRTIILTSLITSIILIVVIICLLINNTKGNNNSSSASNQVVIKTDTTSIDTTANNIETTNTNIVTTSSSASPTPSTTVSPSSSVATSKANVINTTLISTNIATQAPVVTTVKPIEYGPNLLINSGFDSGNSNWSLFTESSITSNSVVWGGRLILQHPDPLQSDGYYQTISNLSKGFIYIFEADTKRTLNVTGIFTIRISQINSNTTETSIGQTYFSNSTSDFEKVKLQVTIPNSTNAVGYKVYLKLTGSGSVEIDNTKLYSQY